MFERTQILLNGLETLRRASLRLEWI